MKLQRMMRNLVVVRLNGCLTFEVECRHLTTSPEALRTFNEREGFYGMALAKKRANAGTERGAGVKNYCTDYPGPVRCG